MRDSDKCFPIRARDILLRPLTITSCEILQTVRLPMVLLFAGLAVFTLVLFDAAQLRHLMAWWQAFGIWIIAVATQIAAYCALLLAWGWGQNRYRAPQVFLPLVGLSAYLLTYSVILVLVTWATGRPAGEMFGPGIFLTGYAFAIISEAIYFAFVLPQLLREVRGGANGGQARAITVAGQRFDIDSLLVLRGQAHYVLIETREGTHRLRGRLSDLVAQTEEGDGVRAHRSYWVSGQAISRLEREDGGDTIVTIQGERLKVAQPRRLAVRSWMAQHAPDAMGQAQTT